MARKNKNAININHLIFLQKKKYEFNMMKDELLCYCLTLIENIKNNCFDVNNVNIQNLNIFLSNIHTICKHSFTSKYFYELFVYNPNIFFHKYIKKYNLFCELINLDLMQSFIKTCCDIENKNDVIEIFGIILLNEKINIDEFVVKYEIFDKPLIIKIMVFRHYKIDFDDKKDLLFIKNYIYYNKWLYYTFDKDVIILNTYLEILKEKCLIESNINLTMEKVDYSKRINRDISNILKLLSLYGIFYNKDDIQQLINSGIYVGNIRLYGLEYDDLDINIQSQFYHEYKLQYKKKLNEKNFINVLINEADLGVIEHFIKNGSVINENVYNEFLKKCVKHDNFNKFENIICKYCNLTIKNLEDYEKEMKINTGFCPMITILKDNMQKSQKINLEDIDIQINQKKLNKFTKNNNEPFISYFKKYIHEKNLIIDEYFVTDNYLSKMFNVHEHCLIDIKKIDDLLK